MVEIDHEKARSAVKKIACQGVNDGRNASFNQGIPGWQAARGVNDGRDERMEAIANSNDRL